MALGLASITVGLGTLNRSTMSGPASVARGASSGFGMRLKSGRWMMFNDKRILNYMSRAKRKSFNYFGAWVAKTARRSIRKRKNWSDPGHQPHSHVGLLRKLIYWGYDPVTDSEVIGPARLKSRSPYEPRTVPEVLEYGGVVKKEVTGALLGALLHAGKHTPRAYNMYHALKGKRGQTVAITYKPRPYMHPAFRAAFQDEKLMNAMWSKSVMKQAPAA